MDNLKALAARFSARPGGYTRVLKAGYRKGDRAAMAYIEYVDNTLPPLRPQFTAEEIGLGPTFFFFPCPKIRVANSRLLIFHR